MPKSQTPLPRLRGLTLDKLTAFVQSAGQPAFRARQLYQWLFQKGALSFDEMTNLPKDFRAWLAEHAMLGGVRLVKTTGDPDGTQKLLLETEDGEHIESVLMRGEDDEDEDADFDAGKNEDEGKSAANDFEDRHTAEYRNRKRTGKNTGSTPPQRRVSLCVSSQIGCALGCVFCLTGQGGFRRDLRVDEILGQPLVARRLLAPGDRLTHMVFMGMGEPMLNLKAVLPALQILTDPDGFSLAGRRVTVSTAGVIPGMREFIAADPGVGLALSLNATTQSLRDRLMPACHNWPIENVLDVCRHLPQHKRRRVTFEYILLKDFNDTPDDLQRLKTLLKGIPCKINLILYNSSERSAFEPTPEPQAEAFRAALAKAHFTASLRVSKGREYQAACGQLAGHAR